jgi:conjugative transfer region lipoprotein (TIGR03751 family)
MDWTDRYGHLALAGLVLLSGCTAFAPRESPLPKDGPDLVEVYRHHLATEGVEARSPRERLPLRAPEDWAGQRRTDLDPMRQRFQRLPNPDLVMHVFPHLTRGRYPVPGYVTVFPMYERVEYAMPGEVAPRTSALDAARPPLQPASAARSTGTPASSQ